MKSEKLASYAKLVDGPGNCGEHREAIAALLAYAHDLECAVEIHKSRVERMDDSLNKIHDLAGQMGNIHPHVGAIQDWVHQVSPCDKTHPIPTHCNGMQCNYTAKKLCYCSCPECSA